MVFLIYGDGPVGERLKFYLDGWSQHRKLFACAVLISKSPSDLGRVMNEVFTTYVWTQGSSPVTCIINAWEVHGVPADLNAERSLRENAIAAGHLALAARAREVPLLQLSTSAVFRGGGMNTIEKPPSPVSIYGVSKHQAEQAVLALHPSRGKIGASVLRLGPLYGYDMNWCPPVEAARYAVAAISEGPTSPTFASEAMFLIARNLLESPQLLREPVAHCAPGFPPISWFDFLKPHYPNIVKRGMIRVLPALQPTAPWFLPNDAERSFEGYLTEQKTKTYMTYWS